MDNNFKIDQLMLRIQAEAKNVLSNNKQRGVALITINVLMDAGGVPMLWVVSPGKRIEPTKDAPSVIAALLGQSGTDTDT